MSRNDFKDEYEKVKKNGNKNRQKKKASLLKKN